MDYSLSSLKEVYTKDYTGDYYEGCSVLANSSMGYSWQSPKCQTTFLSLPPEAFDSGFSVAGQILTASPGL